MKLDQFLESASETKATQLDESVAIGGNRKFDDRSGIGAVAAAVLTDASDRKKAS